MIPKKMMGEEVDRSKYPGHTNQNLFEIFIAKALTKDTVVLDAGCGNGEFSVTSMLRAKVNKIVGIDTDKTSLESNPDLDVRVVASVENMPLENNGFDLVISRALIEHLRNPAAAILEFARVLKPGGKAVLQTYNIYSPVMFASAILPLDLRKWIKDKVLRKPEGTYPTLYRCNSKRKFMRISKQAELEIVRFQRYGDKPDYWKHRFLNSFFIRFDKLADFQPFNFLKPELLIVLKKIGSEK